MNKLAMDFAYEFRIWSQISNRFVFTLDANSWRKDFNKTYKANRIQKNDINWDNVWTTINDFSEILKSHGIIVNRINGTEGDDLMFAWSSYLNSKDENVILWTGDSDLHQLVSYNRSNNAYTLCYGSVKSTLYVYPGFERWLNEEKQDADIFNIGVLHKDAIKDSLLNMIRTNKWKLEPIFCDEYVFKKILMGDSGDNVKSVIEIKKMTKTGKERTYRITDKKATLILNKFKEVHRRMSIIYLFDDTYLDDIINIVMEVVQSDSTYAEIKNALQDNISLILLHRKTIPDVIYEEMLNEVELSYLKRQALQESLQSKDTILRHSKYYKQSTSISGFTIDEETKATLF